MIQRNVYISFLFLVLVSIGNLQICHSQIPSIEDIQSVKSRKLLVLLAEPDMEVIEELKVKNSSLIGVYKESFNIYNANLKIAMDSFWGVHNEYKFITQMEAELLRKEKNEDFAIVFSFYVTSLGYLRYNLEWQSEDIIYNALNYHKYKRKGIYALSVVFSEDYGNGKLPIMTVPSNRFIPTKTEMACMVNVLNSIFLGNVDDAERIGIKHSSELKDKNCDTLKQLILLINENNIEDGLTFEKIKEIYPYDFMITNDKFIDSITYSKNKKYVYLYAYPLFEVNLTYFRYHIINCSDLSGIIICTLNPFDFLFKKNYWNQEDSYADNDAKIITEKAILEFVSKIGD